MNSHRIGSLVLLAGGVVLVFGGLTSALGYSPAGMAASGAAIVALLYAGGVWFGPTPPADPHVILFTRQLEAAGGPRGGRSIVEQFPSQTRASIEQHCRGALEGRAARFTCGRTAFAVSPVRSPEGAVVYGLLLTGRAAEAAEAQLTRAV
jgi:hypothetical protein